MTKDPSLQPDAGSKGGSKGEGGEGGRTVGKPAVISADPAAGATEVVVDKIVTITFGEDVQQGNDFDKIVLKDSAGKQVVCTVSITGNKLTVAPKEKLAYSTTYTLFIPAGAVKDADNNTMSRDYTLTFTTAAALPKPPVSFKDMTGHWAAETVAKLAGMGAILGYPDGTFRPDKTITRAEIAFILTRVLKLAPGDESTLPFADKNEIPAWACRAVAAAAREGLLKGYPVQGGVVFTASNPVTRVELAVILSRVVENKKVPASSQVPAFVDAAAIPVWAKNAVNIATVAGIVSGYPDGTFKPAKNVTRAEAASMILRFLEKVSG